VAQNVAQDPKNAETPDNAGVLKYRYRDSNPVLRLRLLPPVRCSAC
jgi:hypothetical protein